jgi:hypothetical protein
VRLDVPTPSGGGRVLFVGNAYNGFDPVVNLLPKGWSGLNLSDREFRISSVMYRVWRLTAQRWPSLIQRKYEEWLLRAFHELRPQLVVVKRGTFVSRRLLDAFHEQGAFAFNVNNDAWDPENRNNIHPVMLEAAPRYDIHFPSKARNVAWLRERGAPRVEYMRLWYSPNMFYRESLPPDVLQPWRSDACFVGSYEAARARSLLHLARALPDLRLKVYGNMWEKARLPAASALRRCVAYRDAIQRDGRCALMATRIGLGFLRKGNGDSHTSRTFEIPATGACMLMEHSSEQAALFPEGEAWVGFKSNEELVEKARWLLADDAARQRIAETGHRLVTEGPHSLRHRLARMLWCYAELSGRR